MWVQCQFEKSTEAINFFGTAIAPGAGSRFGFVPGVVPQMDLPKGIVAPALPLRWYIYWNGVTETSKNHQRTEAPPNSNEASPCCSLTTLNLSWNSLGWDANRWLGEKGPYMATDVIAKRYTHTQTRHIYHIIYYIIILLYYYIIILLYYYIIILLYYHIMLLYYIIIYYYHSIYIICVIKCYASYSYHVSNESIWGIKNFKAMAG